MSEYLKHEHDFVERPTKALQERLSELHLNMRNIGYTGLRLAQVQSEIDFISFEISSRYAEEKELAWAENGKV